MANQYDPLVIKSGLAGVLGTDTLRADVIAHAGLTTTGLASGDVVQVTANLTLSKASNLLTTPIVGVYDGVSGSIVREGVVVATFTAGLTLANGDAVYLSSDDGKLTNVKPTKGVLHEVGVVVDATNKKVLLQQKPVIALPPLPPLSLWLTNAGQHINQLASPSGALLGTVNDTGVAQLHNPVWDGNYIWAHTNEIPLRVCAYDPFTRVRVKGPYTVGTNFGSNPRRFIFDGTNYWIWNSAWTIQKFNASGTVLATVTPCNSQNYNVVHSIYNTNGDSIIVCLEGGGSGLDHNRVFKVNKTTNAVTYGTTTYYTTGEGCVYGDYFYGIMVDRMDIPPTWCGIYKMRISDMTQVASQQLPGWSYGPDCLVIDGTYYYMKGFNTDTKFYKYRMSDMAGMWGVQQSSVNNVIVYDGLYLWSFYGSSTIFKRTNLDTGAYTNFTVEYYAGGLCTTKSPLPWPNP